MPARTAPRCGRRGAGRLTQTDELVLLWGHVFGVKGWERPLQTHAEFVALWGRWRDKITPRWIAANPGSRPMAAYLAGDIPAPTWQHDLPALRHPVRIGDRGVVIPDRGWHQRQAELDHLVALGIVGRQEQRRAEQRLEAGSAWPTKYRDLHDDDNFDV